MPASDHYWRPLALMHKVFAGSAFALFGATIIMMAVDEHREWREYQARAEELRYEKLREEASQYSRDQYRQQLEELKDNIQAAKDAVASEQGEITRLEADLAAVSGEVERLQRLSKDMNADRDVARANYDLGVRDQVGAEKLQELRRLYNEAQEVAQDYAGRLEEALGRRGDVQAELDALREAVAAAERRRQDFEFQEQQLRDQMNQLRPESWFAALKREIKTWPIINGFNPELTLQDKQDWIPELKVQLGMARVARFDRCRACHVHIDRFAAGGVAAFPYGELEDGKYPHPFASHPHSELYVADASPHPKTRFGCTICHDGDGSGTSFQNSEHTPDDPIEAEHWEAEYDWHSNHFWEYPMLPTQFIESTCIKCHHNVTELGVNPQYGASAPKVYEGYNLIAEYGCFGCHEINGYNGTESIGPDLRLEPNTPEQLAALEADPNQVPGRMRKVGPSLRHVADKTTAEFIAYWVEIPKRFRPDTRMPQFFDLTNQTDALAAQLQPVELAGIAAYLMEASQPLELEQPVPGYTPDAERGKHLFSRRGCLACHSHDDPDFAGIRADFGPNLTRVHEKIRPGQDGFNWLYTWLRDPTRYHTRTRMPNLFLTPEGEEDNYVDPAADIAAFLLQGGPGAFPEIELPAPYLGIVADNEFTLDEAEELGLESTTGVRVLSVLQGSSAERATTVPAEGATAVEAPLEMNDVIVRVGQTTLENPGQLDELIAGQAIGAELVLTVMRHGNELQRSITVSDGLRDLTRLYLEKSLTSGELDQTLESGIFKRRERVVAPDGTASWEYVPASRESIKGDEIELLQQPGDGESLDEETKRHRELVFVGRRTVSRYGCYGCHDIPGFEEARPIGTALQDWGRKDTSKLALEHIEEWLQHHGEPDGGSTHDRIERILTQEGESATHQQRMAAYFYESLLHHGRPGFLWQKLRQPRSYDYRKTETKGWDERLRMPRFPFEEPQIESIATFVLGLVADPPPSDYQYQPEGAAYARIEGDRLLRQYNCTGCHMLETPGFRYEADLRELVGMTRDELETWFTDRADALADGTIPQPALSNVALPTGFTPPEGMDPELARRLREQASLESPSLDRFLRKLDDEIDDEEERNKPQSFVISDTEAYYRELFDSIGDPERRAEAIARERTFVGHMEDFLPNAVAFLQGRLPDVTDAAVQITPLIGRLVETEVQDKDKPTPLQEWLDNHQELLLVDRLPDADIPESVRAALSLKPPVSHWPPITSGEGSAVLEAHGLTVATPDPEETDPEFRQYVFDLWENLDVGGRYKLMGINSRFLVQEDRVVEILPSRGGDFAEWLVPQLVDDEMAGDLNKSWQASPPPLYKEGVKVQTPWLYRFLLNPEQLRYTTVLRMPRFNMSETEARHLANYFAAVDNQPFPYQENYRHQPEYLDARSTEFQAEFPTEGDDYLFKCWQVLNAPLCIKCHAVGGRPYQGSDPTKDIQGPNLERVESRLRPEWVHLWIYKPAAITSYTSMPSNFAANQEQFPDLFDGKPQWQVEGVVDALMNYYNLMERHGVTIYEPPMSEQPAEGAEAASSGGGGR